MRPSRSGGHLGSRHSQPSAQLSLGGSSALGTGSGSRATALSLSGGAVLNGTRPGSRAGVTQPQPSFSSFRLPVPSAACRGDPGIQGGSRPGSAAGSARGRAHGLVGGAAQSPRDVVNRSSEVLTELLSNPVLAGPALPPPAAASAQALPRQGRPDSKEAVAGCLSAPVENKAAAGAELIMAAVASCAVVWEVEAGSDLWRPVPGLPQLSLRHASATNSESCKLRFEADCLEHGLIAALACPQEVDVAFEVPLARVLVGERQLARLRPRAECWQVATASGGWINCPARIAQELSNGFPTCTPSLGASDGEKQQLQSVQLGELPMSLSQHRSFKKAPMIAVVSWAGHKDPSFDAMGYFDGYAREQGQAPYRLTVGLTSVGRTSHGGWRSRRPCERDSAGSSASKDRVPIRVLAFAGGVRIWDDAGGSDFWLFGDVQSDGSIKGTIGRSGVSGAFHLAPGFEPLLPLDVEPKGAGPWDAAWLSGIWAVLPVKSGFSGCVPVLAASAGTPFHELALSKSDKVRIDLAGSRGAWRLAPGELQRLGGPLSEDAFVPFSKDGRALLVALDAPNFSVIPTLHVLCENQGYARTLRRGPPSPFPEAVIGPWIRVMGRIVSAIEVRDDSRVFIDGEENGMIAVWPEVVYVCFGIWVLDAVRSTPAVLVWAGGGDPECFKADSTLLVWKRPWLMEGHRHADVPDQVHLSGIYAPPLDAAPRLPECLAGLPFSPLSADGCRDEKSGVSLMVNEAGEANFYQHGQPMAVSAPAAAPEWASLDLLDHPAVKRSFAVDALRLGVTPRKVCELPRGAQLAISRGSATCFSGDAVILQDYEPWCGGQVWSAALIGGGPELARAIQGLPQTSGSSRCPVGEARAVLAGRLPATWAIVTTLRSEEEPTQLCAGIRASISASFQLAKRFGVRSLGLSVLGGTARVREEERRHAGRRLGRGGKRFYCRAYVGRDGYFGGKDRWKGHTADTCNCDGHCGPNNGCQCRECYAHTYESGSVGPHMQTVEGFIIDAIRTFAYDGLEVHLLISDEASIGRALEATDVPDFEALMRQASEQVCPPWVPSSLVRSATRTFEKGGIPDTSLRGISVKQLCELGNLIKNKLEEHDIVDLNKRSATVGQRITWDIANMHHICKNFVMPITATAKCSYVEAISGIAQPPTWMISHSWNTPFQMTQAMLKCHASRRSGAVADGTFYWCCTLANNQHDLSDLQGDEIMKSPFARVLTSSECIGTVLICDPQITPLSRVWCVFEEHVTQQLRIKLLGSKPVHFLDVAVPAAAPGQRLPASAASCADEVPVALLLDALSGSWNSYSNTPGMHFPLEVARIGVQVDIRKAEASVVEDLHRILNFVARGCSDTGVPPSSHENYDKLNDFVHGIFASAELYRQACERPAGCVERIKQLLDSRADPNKFVRQGNSALFAVVGADEAAPALAPLDLTSTLLRMLLAARADPNVINAGNTTVLDCVVLKGGIDESVQAALRGAGARRFVEIAPILQRQLTEAISSVTEHGFSSDGKAFGGGGGGGSGAKLMPQAEHCLFQVSTFFQRFPLATGVIHVLDTKADRLKKRGASVVAALQNMGCSNNFVVRYVSRGPTVSISFSLLEAAAAAEGGEGLASLE